MSALETRYRRLLAWYPQDHRARHGEEMIGVLLAGAEPGRSFPDPRDAFDLLRGAVAIRVQRLVGPASSAHWRDALNAAAIVAPLFFLVTVTGPVAITLFVSGPASLRDHLVSLALAFLPNGLLLLLALRGPRWAAVAWAWIWGLGGSVLTYHTLLVLIGETAAAAEWFIPSAIVSQSLPGVLAALLMTFASRPAEGVNLVGRGTLLRWTAVSALALAATTIVWHAFMVDLFIEQMTAPALIAMACGAGCRTPVGRRAVLLLLPIVLAVQGQQAVMQLELRGWPPLLLEVLLIAVLFTVARHGFRPYGSGTVSSPDRLA
ncbi:hypothetical protein [Planomonospora venezuelensis]|uniref:Uncharacterized protein n=1 Tax=Planomonospora venezuelensis TaxID=1999 RepID=A0A841DHC9_PLAVE|nr:hypothetical protein [Planomonospora venezuelensis]MBB5966586.1 hypothetical protein [Planomonospora venezuelensis]GIN02236.1 hypothetical protein Pve01_38940 [Planomonospora venezuelensis]